MREIVSSQAPKSSRVLTGIFVVLGLALIWIGRSIAIESLGVADPTILGVNAALGFIVIGLMAIIYFRLSYGHRIVLEYDEDLW